MMLALGTAYGQMRPGQPRTISPSPPPLHQTQDVVGPFRVQYRAAGSPRVVLFWNVAFDPATETPRSDVTVRDAEVYPFVTDDGEVGLREFGMSMHANGHFDPARGGRGALSASDLAALDSAFRNQLIAANVRLLDRASTIRFMQAQHDRAAVDPKLIEADAVLGRADILLQVLLVRDESSPLGTGFKVSAIRVMDGEEIASLYTIAVSTLPGLPGHYVATDSGFRWQQPPLPIPDASEIGTTLADYVMKNLIPVLASMRRGCKPIER